MWTTITSVIFFIFGIAKTDNGYVDYKTQEMYNLECRYTDRECARKTKNDGRGLFIEDVNWNGKD